MVFLSLVVLVAALVIDYLIAEQFYLCAERKGFAEGKYLWICFFCGIIGYLLVIALPDRQLRFTISGETGNDSDTSSNSWRCSCGRVNANYVYSCACGKSRHDHMREQQGKK